MEIPSLPIDTLQGAFVTALGAGPVVVSAPTGSGKSTVIPRWCAELGRVLVVEPRRVACRSLAQRVAELTGSPLGEDVGYVVRDEARARERTRILFATTGVVLQRLARGELGDVAAVVLDEYHERSLDVDLILALLLERPPPHLVVMSATLAGDALARHIGGQHLVGEGRVWPVARRHLGDHSQLPTLANLEARVGAALDKAAEDPGDVLVFLPGKGEIAAVEAALAGRARRGGVEIIPLHGGLSLGEQARAFAPSDRRKVILATNVAETSITLPGVGVVIDSGLARQTRYHQGRGYLGVVAIAQDSAEQRAGRAGRTAAGVCYRLWGEGAILSAYTPPEMHRESLVPLALGAAACGARAEALRFPDPPREHALLQAQADLKALGALDEDGAITPRGRALYALPLDAHLGRVLIEAQEQGALPDAVDLVAALAVGRPLFRGGPRPEEEADDLQAAGCDAVALVRAVREGETRRHRLSPFALGEARRIAGRLRGSFGLPPRHDGPPSPDRQALARVLLAADPRCALLARRRKREIAWGGGGREMQLGRETAVDPEKAEALLALQTRAFGGGYASGTLVVTAAMPVPIPWLARAGLGEEAVAAVSLEGGCATARIERSYAGRVIATREEIPRGALAREALVKLFLEGRLFRGARDASAERLEIAALHKDFQAQAITGDALWESPWDDAPSVPDLETWARDRIAALGVSSGEDVALLSPEDLTAPDLPEPLRERLDRSFPRRLSFGDAHYKVLYDLSRREVMLDRIQGDRREPPPLAWLPAFRGFSVLCRHKNAVKVLRGR